MGPGERRLKARKRRILVIDDDSDSCDIVSTLLAHVGYESTCVSDSQEAVPLILHERFDAFFVDLVLPGLSGFDLLQVIRASPYNAEKPVLAVSAHTEYRQDALDSGFTDFLHKPVELARMRLLLDRVFPQQ